jgi:DNA ligase-1
LVISQDLVESLEDVDALFERNIDTGYEGVILRDINGPYKFGRSTVKEGYMLKVKPFHTWDSPVLDILERFENLNESQTNELGQSFKRNTKADKAGTGLASALVTEYEGHPIKVVLTGDEDFRREIWENKESYIGKLFEWKGMIVGAKDVPRHPNFIRWREDKDG